MKNAIATKNAPGAIGPYSQAIATDTMIYTSGQLGLTPEGVLYAFAEGRAVAEKHQGCP